MDNYKKKFWKSPNFFIGLIIIFYLVVGLLVVTQYGESFDEPSRIGNADRSLAAYRSSPAYFFQLEEKGPFYSMLARIGSKSLIYLFSGWRVIDGWHFMNFAAFVIGVYFFYRLCRRLIEPVPALAATLLFGTQPLLWGHAFINPKDIPFMAFFLASVTLGLEMVDHFNLQPPVPGVEITLKSQLVALRHQLASDWKCSPLRLHRLFFGLTILLTILLICYMPLRVLIGWFVGQAFNAPSSNWLGNLFHQVAHNAYQIPLQAYIIKAQTLFSRGVLWVGISICLVMVWIARLVFPSVVGPMLHLRLQSRVLLAGLFLGLCSDIRTLGPASGLLVAAYFFVKAGIKAIPVLLQYLAIGALTIYFFWPDLWKAPIQNYLFSLSQASKYPWNSNIQFAGRIYTPGNLPGSYLPTLFTLQFTETALALIFVGLIIAVAYLIRKPNLRMDVLLLGAWGVSPVAAAILMHSTVYNNFRQFLFVVPPFFVLAGLAMNALWKRLKRKTIYFAILILVVLLPALYWDIQLHPYQYMYYNSLVGGLAGASGDYETDYWDTTYKEAIEYVNQVAPQGAVVSFWGSYITAIPYARPDLALISLNDKPDPGFPINTQVDFAILPAQQSVDQHYFPGSKEIYRIQRGGAILTVVKEVKKGDLIQGK